MYALKFLWSISVEEQFYLVFLALSPLFKRGMKLPIIILTTLYFGYMFLAPIYSWSTFWPLPPYFIFFAAGMLGAEEYCKRRCNTVPTSFISALSILALVLFDLPEIWLNLTLALMYATLILTVVKVMKGKSYHQWSGISLTEQWGQYSYALYIFSGFILTFIPLLIPLESNILKWFLNFGVLLTISYLSYHLYEKHFLKLKTHFR
jgi:peptidoglycan/LPS O-acetylase OafA/YrhL